jgi:hypothetical protein
MVSLIKLGGARPLQNAHLALAEGTPKVRAHVAVAVHVLVDIGVSALDPHRRQAHTDCLS